MVNLVIGLQARSASQRLPNKIHMTIGGRPMLQWIIESCNRAIKYMAQDCERLGAKMKLVLLVPKGDSAVDIYKGQMDVMEGHETDVLSRYVECTEKYNADFIMRVTGDCLFLPSHLISKHAKTTLLKERDYTSNVHVRTFKEGLDCEVLSKRLVAWLNENAKEPQDREHVTTLIGPDKPFPFLDREGKKNIAHVLNYFYEADEKTSIDTIKDFETARELFRKFADAKSTARKNGIFIV